SILLDFEVARRSQLCLDSTDPLNNQILENREAHNNSYNSSEKNKIRELYDAVPVFIGVFLLELDPKKFIEIINKTSNFNIFTGEPNDRRNNCENIYKFLLNSPETKSIFDSKKDIQDMIEKYYRK